MRKSVVVVFVLLLAASMPAFADAALYKAKCAMCHGADGKKENKATNLRPLVSPEVQKQTDEQLTAVTANGKGKMPAYKGKLTDDQIKSVVAAIRDLAKK